MQHFHARNKTMQYAICNDGGTTRGQIKHDEQVGCTFWQTQYVIQIFHVCKNMHTLHSMHANTLYYFCSVSCAVWVSESWQVNSPILALLQMFAQRSQGTFTSIRLFGPGYQAIQLCWELVQHISPIYKHHVQTRAALCCLIIFQKSSMWDDMMQHLLCLSQKKESEFGTTRGQIKHDK